MNLAVKKVEIIQWLAQVKDESVLEKVENLRVASLKKKNEADMKPMTAKAFKAMLQKAESDFSKGLIISQENLEKDSRNW